jgi:predicted signal transduction protein with EAL and GGDEF domain
MTISCASVAVGRPRILCVDADADILATLAGQLAERYQVEFATDGDTGLALLRRHPDIVVIVADLGLAGQGGANFLAASRRIAPDARRILLTACHDMATAISAVNDGQICRFLTKPCDEALLLEGIEFALAEHRTEMVNRHERERFAARDILGRDRVTGLASRERMLEALGLAIVARHLLTRPVGTLYLLHIRFVPPFAENADSAAVDLWLHEIARKLVSEAGAATCVARWDKHAFAVFDDVPSVGPATLMARGTALRDSITDSWEIGSVCVSTKVSVGIVSMPAALVEPREVMARAELAEREARGNGGTQIVEYTAATGARAAYQRDIVRALRGALADDALELHYQPIVDIRTHTVHSVEALARWFHPTFGAVPPAVFIPLAEAAGLIVPLGAWVLQRACRDAAVLLTMGFPRIALNVSVLQLIDPGFLGDLRRALADSGIPPAALEIEVTESVFAQDLERISQILAMVRDLGVSIAIDDFGTGYSSLAYLNQLPANVVKIDGAFIRDFERGGDAILGATIHVAERMHRATIVEGVETEVMLDQARTIGATLVQGFHFARPMPLRELVAWRTAFTRSAAGDRERGRTRAPPHDRSRDQLQALP